MKLALAFRLCLAVALSLVPVRVLGQHPTHPTGFSPEKAYEVGLVDKVDLFSGSLSLSLPIGPLALTYSSSRLWSYEDVNGGISADAYHESNAGFGWRLGFGDVYHRKHPNNNSGRWQLIDPSGGSHIFKDNLHKGEPTESGFFYSRDNTYLRFRVINDNNVEIESPDGKTRRYEKVPGGANYRLRFVKEWSRYGSYSDPDLEVTYSFDPEVWTVTDRYGRTHTMTFDYNAPNLDDAITEIDLESFQGQSKVYSFTYENRWIERSCKDTDGQTGPNIQVAFLTQIDLPDGTSYKMKDGSTLLYDEECHGGGLDETPGTILGLILPTGGKYDWTYDLYTYPDPDPVWSDNVGVKTKTMKDRNDLVLGVWTYSNDSDPPQGNHPEARTQVVYPTGDCTKHHFNARWWLSTSNPKAGWEYGLPFAYSQENNGFYLSEEIWDSSTGENCSGTKLRSTYLKYDRDELPNGTNEPEWWSNSNRRLVGTRTVFHEDGGRWTQTDHLQFDGLGHFREVKTTSDFWSGSSNSEERTVVTNYSRTTGTYPGSYVPVPTTTPWVLGIYDYIEATELDSPEQAVSKTEYAFDTSTGVLLCERSYEDGTSRGSSDVLSTYEYDALGLRTDLKSYGGDLQTLATSGSNCGDLPNEPEYWSRFTHHNGVIKTTVQLQPDGTPNTFLTYDVDLDASSGVVIASRDPAGLTTTYDYDVSGRPTSVTPPGRASYEFSYENSAGADPARLKLERREGAEVLAEMEIDFDDFGRRWKERVLLPDQTWSEQETLYNPRGWVISRSERGDITQRTEYLGYDPFGRHTILRPPSGPSDETLTSYIGERSRTEQTKISLLPGEAYVSRTVEFDSYGRLRSVSEHSDSGQPLSTSYQYDVRDMVVRITTGPSAAGVTQEREFAYDGRGFLLSETQPERGISGNGDITYSDYDSAGRLGRRVDGTSDIGLTYDFLGRPTQTRDKAKGDRLLTNYTYDTSSGNAIGKLRTSRRNNWLDLPWNGGGDEWVAVFRTHFYDASSGAPAQTNTMVRFQGESDKTFVHRYQQDQLGNISQIENPYCNHTSCSATVGAGLVIDSQYEEGRLSEVVGWTDGITYHSSGGLNTVKHINGLTDHYLSDQSQISRIGRVCVRSSGTCGGLGGAALWDSGNYGYDGTGNIKQIGTDSFYYDEVSRLVDGSEGGWNQTYTYDAFGNLVARTTDDGQGGTSVTYSVDSSTNRLTAGTYDASGNLTGWAGTSFAYSALGELRGIDTRWLYLYDADGARAATIDWTGSVPSRRITYTIRDGLRRSEGLSKVAKRVLAVFEQVGSDQSGAWERLREYVFADDTLFASTGDEVRHYHLDHLGSPRLITSDTASVIASQDLLPYGQELTPAADETLKFTGHERDETTGLDYMIARYYDSDLSRFLSIDPELGFVEAPQSLNRYAYGLSNPINLLDPDGRLVAAVSGAPVFLGNACLDTMVEGLGGLPGFGAVGVYHNQGGGVYDHILGQLAQDPTQPIYLVGHSWGADFVVDLARRLTTDGYAVTFVLTFDPTVENSLPEGVPGVNYHRPDDYKWGGKQIGGAQNRQEDGKHRTYPCQFIGRGQAELNQANNTRSRIGELGNDRGETNSGSGNPFEVGSLWSDPFGWVIQAREASEK